MNSKNKSSLKLDARLVIILLLAIIVAMLLLWTPWIDTNTDAKNRTIKVTGETTITEAPDEFVFSPTYQFKNADKTAALAEVTKKSNEITKKLKSLGVAANKIKSDASGNDYTYYYDDSTDQNTYSLHLTVTVNKKDQVQKVQDYLVTTEPTGSVTPRAMFSKGKQKELENKARDEAAKDARAKAERTAKNLDVTLGEVKSITDSSGIRPPVLLQDRMSVLSPGSIPQTNSLEVQPGENEIPFSITVTYYVKD